MKQHIVIVGANLAGGRAAEALRSEGFDGSITLIGAEPHLPYERPPLSKEFLGSQEALPSSFLYPESFYRENTILLQLGKRAVRLDRREQSVELDTGEHIQADAFLLCTGCHVRRLAVPGADLPGVQYLRTIEDALAIRAHLTPARKLVIIGGGFIGAEVAASARAMGCAVTMLEVAPLLLQRVLHTALGEFYTQLHRDHGIQVLTGVGVERIGGQGHAQYVVTTQGQILDADLVVVAVGVEPAVELARDAGIAVENGILVDEYCQTSVPGIYAAGDVANHPDASTGMRIRLEHWQNAQNQALVAARAMLGHKHSFVEIPWFWSDQYDVKMQMAGYPLPTDRVIFRGNPASQNFTAFYLRDATLAGAVAINRPRDIRTALKLIENHTVVSSEALADEQIALRDLLQK